MAFKKADKKQSFLRMALLGPAGGGKTYTALLMAMELAQGGKVAVIDTERGSASKYADKWSFDVVDDWPDFAVGRYIQAIQEAGEAGYRVLVIDSLSHAWAGQGGILEFVDSKAGNNKFSGWKDATPLHNKLVDAILTAKMHVIVTMRTKTEYVQEKDEKGKTIIRKMGLQPVQRDGLEYEFDIIGDFGDSSDTTPTLQIGKTRCEALRGHTARPPGPKLAETIRAWLEGGAVAETPTQAPPKEEGPKVEIEQPGLETLDAARNMFGITMNMLDLPQEKAWEIFTDIQQRKASKGQPCDPETIWKGLKGLTPEQRVKLLTPYFQQPSGK